MCYLTCVYASALLRARVWTLVFSLPSFFLFFSFFLPPHVICSRCCKVHTGLRARKRQAERERESRDLSKRISRDERDRADDDDDGGEDRAGGSRAERRRLRILVCQFD